jgi:isopentenyl-diphosphate Delta-isomerase
VDDYATPSPKMIIDTVDLLDRPRGTTIRRNALARKQNFRVAHLFLFNTAGELLVQQLADTRKRHPLAWGSSVAAYLFAGETYGDAIQRRTAQELGREIAGVEFMGATRMHDLESEKFISLFCGQYDGPFEIDTQHVAAIEFLRVAKIRSMLTSGSRTFTPTFRHLFAFYLNTLSLYK